MLADVTPPEKRGATFGLMGAAFGLGFILGPAIGGLMAGLGTRAPFIAAAALAGLNALWISFRLPETLPAEQAPAVPLARGAYLRRVQAALPRRRRGALLIAAFLWQIGHIVYPATWAFWAELALGWDARAIGWSLAASGLAMGLAQVFVTGRVIARFGEARTVVIGMVVGGLSFLAYVFVTQSWMVYAIIAFGALQGLVYPSMNALLSRMTDASHQGALDGRHGEHRQHRRDHRPAGDDPGAGLRRRARRARRRLPARGLACRLRIAHRALRRGAAAQARRGERMTIEIHHFAAADGTKLAWHEPGEGPPVLLLHGLFSDARTNWIRFGHAAEIAGPGLPRDHAGPARAWAKRQAARSGLLSARHLGR